MIPSVCFNHAHSPHAPLNTPVKLSLFKSGLAAEASRFVELQKEEVEMIKSTFLAHRHGDCRSSPRAQSVWLSPCVLLQTRVSVPGQPASKLGHQVSPQPATAAGDFRRAIKKPPNQPQTQLCAVCKVPTETRGSAGSTSHLNPPSADFAPRNRGSFPPPSAPQTPLVLPGGSSRKRRPTGSLGGPV